MREADKTIDEVIDSLVAHYGMTPYELVTTRRIRWLTLYLCFCMTHRSVSQIIHAFEDVKVSIGPTNIVFAIRWAERKMETDPPFKAQIEALKRQIIESGPSTERSR